MLERPETAPIHALGLPPPGLGQVCVLRPHELGAALTSAVRDNGVLVGATEGTSYFCYFAEPGHHEISVEVSDADATVIELLPGQRAYLHHRINIGADELRWIDASTAERMLGECEYVLVASPPEGERPPGATPLARARRSSR